VPIKSVRTALMPGQISDRCRALVRRITATVTHWGLYCSAEDRAAALLVCAFGEIARIDDPDARENFLEGHVVGSCRNGSGQSALLRARRATTEMLTINEFIGVLTKIALTEGMEHAALEKVAE
jgi:hypothetical protein